MDLELFIHGVPNGQKINGVSGDNTYFTTFYNPSKKEFQGALKFLIEIRNLNGTNYCYYSFLNYNNVSANDGRSGSYIGLTIRIDEYCNDPYRILCLLYVLYRRYVVGTLFDANRNRFLISDFIDEKLQPIREYLTVLFEKCFSGNDFVKIQNQNFNVQEEFIINWSDSLSIDLWDCLKKGRVLLATDYPSFEGKRIIAEWENKLAALQSSHQQQLNAKDEELTKSNQNITSLNGELSRRDSMIRNLTAQLNAAENRNTTLQKSLDRDVLHEIGNSIRFFSKTNKSHENKGNKESVDGDIPQDRPQRKSNKSLLLILIISLLNLFIGISVVAYYFFVSNSKANTSGESNSNPYKEQIEELEIEKNELETLNESLQKNLNVFNGLINKEKDKAKIDIKGFSGKELELNKEYKAEIKGFPYLIGKWECSDNVKVGENTSAYLEFIVLKEGSVFIAYKIGEITVYRRELKADD